MATPYLAASLVMLRAETNAAWPARDKSSDGWIGDTAHSTRVSDHNPDPVTGVVRATDTDEDLDGDRVNRVGDAAQLVDRIVANRDPRVAYLIYEGRIIRSYAKPGIPAWTWAPYSNAATMPHDRHAHVSILHTVAAETDTSSWLTPRGTPATPAEGTDDEMWIISSPWTGQSLVDGGEVTWLDSPAEVTNLRNQGVRVISFATESNVRRFLQERGANVDELIASHTARLAEGAGQ